ncbi:hypothetical protein Tco_1121906 [Tanacetum coccineum]|uniref:Uncharacterized protein n=1 Tax=Tanacetum coccineum TaxID=301880 RepID=A0ABQ5IZG7_9ASTR
MVEEEPLVRERSFRQREEDRLGAEAARRLYEEEQAEQAKEREEQKQKKTKGCVGAFCCLLGPGVNEDNFAARMVALIAERRRQFAAQRSFYDDQLKDEFDKIKHALANLQSQHLRRSLKRQGADLETTDSKKSKTTDLKDSIPASSRPLSAGVTQIRFELLLIHSSSKFYVMLIDDSDVIPTLILHALLHGKIVPTDTPYPLSASTMKKMLKHKLEVEINGIGNDMTHAEQLIAFIKNWLAACLSSA